MKQDWTPKELEAELKKKIIGQDEYLRDLSTCLWLHNQRRAQFQKTGEVITKPKYNMLVIGQSGVGKTSTIQAAAELLDIPFVIEDTSQMTGSGWRGAEVSMIVKDILNASRYTDVDDKCADATFGIVVLDEIDKVFVKHLQDSTFSPVNNLLKCIEGTNLTHSDGNKTYTMNTENILFICMGAFDGLEDIVKKRLSPAKKIGFTQGTAEKEPCPEDNLLKQVTGDDLVEYGISPQLLGRMPLRSVMNELTAADFEQIILESDISPIKQLNSLMLKRLDVKVCITKTAAREIALKVEKGLGARGLQTEIISLMKKPVYKMAVDKDYNKYQLDYRNDKFVVKAMRGKRRVIQDTGGDVVFVLSKLEEQKIGELPIVNKYETEECIQVFTEQMFEGYEYSGFTEFPSHGFVDMYDYSTIRMAQLIAAAAVADVLLRVRHNGYQKTMLELLNIIDTMALESNPKSNHPLATIRNHFLIRFRYYKGNMKKARELAWFIAKRYALDMYAMIHENEPIENDSY